MHLSELQTPHSKCDFLLFYDFCLLFLSWYFGDGQKMSCIIDCTLNQSENGKGGHHTPMETLSIPLLCIYTVDTQRSQFTNIVQHSFCDLCKLYVNLHLLMTYALWFLLTGYEWKISGFIFLPFVNSGFRQLWSWFYLWGKTRSVSNKLISFNTKYVYTEMKTNV